MQDTTPTTEAGFDLDPAEIRVLGVLIEKAFITPDAYPLSINAITTGCNQLTAREPVMNLSEAEVQAAVDSLIARRLVSKRDQASARVAKYEHLVRLRHSLPPAEQAVLAILLLRGAQTAGELRQRCERLHRFDDVAAVDAVLEHLAEKYPPLVTALPRAPGTKETRHVHLLGGDAAVQEMAEAQAGGAAGSGGRGRIGELEDEVRRLREELDALREAFAAFRRQFD
ncbi:MAG: YceH family protein [Thauera sp.]|uniref:YceH family protein n=1 Tax=Thauera sp. JM12B12 TaxID=3142262 RepID=UPI0029C49A85|nr:YceH family protein [Thauera sp.]